MSTEEEQLLDACERGELRTIRGLVESKAVDPNRVVEKRYRSCHSWRTWGWTPLHYTCTCGHLEVVKYLILSTKADVNAKDGGGWTPLLCACVQGHLEVVKFLLTNSQADVNTRDQCGNTPLQLACLNDHLDVVQFLIINAELSVETATASYVQHWASQRGHHKVARMIALALDDPKDRHTRLDSVVAGSQCMECSKKFAFYRRKHRCRRCLNEVCDTCSKHKLLVSDKSSKPERVCDTCFEILIARHKDEQLSADDIRILNIVLVDHLDELEGVGLKLGTAVASQRVITKKSVVECLQQIGQHDFANVLNTRQGVKDLQEYVYKNVYEKALRDEKVEVRLQVFKMILSGVPRSGKTTFWKRIAMKDFQPSETSTSTGVAESHFLSAHMSTEMLFDLHLYSETDTSDLITEALTIYKHIILFNKEAASTQDDSSQCVSVVPSKSSSNDSTEVKHESTSVASKLSSIKNNQSSNYQTSSNDSDQYEKHATSPATIWQSEATCPISISESEYLPEAQKHEAFREIIDENLLAAQKQEIEQICKEIDQYFDELNSLLQKGEKLPIIPTIKKICHLIDTGGQRAFLELLPTVTVGKALYLLFFSYERFEKRLHETVQQQGAPVEIHTGTFYEQMDIVMQSLICVSSTSTTSKDNVALLVGTHVDKVTSQDVQCVNKIVEKKVEPFLNSGLIFAERNKLVLEVSVEKNDRCSNQPEDYRRVIMNVVDNKLSCPESEKLPPSWYMFSILLRRMKLAGHSVLQYSHCQQIAKKLYIKETQLRSLLSRLHKILGIVVYFPEVHELKDIVICNPSVVYRGISELIFNSFDETLNPKLSLRLKRWGIFMFQELKEHCKVESINKGCQLQIDKLIILLKHLGIIAPVQFSESKDSLANPKNDCRSTQNIDPEFIIPSVLDDAQPEELKLQLQDGEACSIIPLRIYFKCGFSPMGGFCYLFTRLISNRKWKLPVEKDQMMSTNRTYWRNKATFIVQADEKKYFVTILSTKEYFEIHVIHTHSKEPFQLGKDGHSICRKIWNDVESVLSNSLNASLTEYTVACECTLHPRDKYPEHVLEFDSKPHNNNLNVKANCLLDKSRPHSLTMDTSEQSVIVWFKEPHDRRTKDMGSVVELSIDHLFMTTSSRDQLKYQWSIEGEEISKDDENFKNIDSDTLIINCFESEYAGTYSCIVSTSSQPIVSMSAEVELDLPEPPSDFSTEMSRKQFFLYLNAGGICYKVCKMLKENKITPKVFNLSSFESWSLDLSLTAMENKALRALLVATDYIKCPVCLNIQVDPCTLPCGHTFCQLCLARLWKSNEKFCPVCKETWKIFPAISYDYRTNIESSYGQQVAQLREQYTQKDKELINEILGAKSLTSFSQTSEPPALAQKITIEEEFGETVFRTYALLPPRTFPKDLNNEQLVMMLTNHPLLMGMDCHHDIERLKQAKLGGKELLSQEKESLEQFGLSTGFLTPLMEIIEDLKQYQHTLKTKIQPYWQKSLASQAATSAAQQSYPSTSGQEAQLECLSLQAAKSKSDEQAATEPTSAGPTETIKTEIEETNASKYISAPQSELDVWKLPGVEECGETSVVISSSQGQLVDWNGLKLHIHKGSMPEGLQQCTIYIKASLAGEYEIPENSSPVSAIFWLRCEPQCTFAKPITVEIQHCSTKQDPSRLKIVRAHCSQKHLPYKFKPLGGRFSADTSYGVIEVNSFSGVGVIAENPFSERMYYSQLFYRSFYRHQQKHDIYITFTWNTEAHINYVSEKYPEKQGFHAGCYQVVELDGDAIKVSLERAQWTKVMDDQWELHPAKSTVTKAELDVFKLGRGIPNCVLEARPLCEQFPQLLFDVTLNGIKPPYNELTLSYMPSRKDPTSDAVQQPQASTTVQPQLDIMCPTPLAFSMDMNYEQLAVWLTNHSQFMGADYQQDINKLKGARINGFALLSLNESRLEHFGVSFGFLVTLMNIIENLKSCQKPIDSERLPSQHQQCLTSSAAPTTTQDQPISDEKINLDGLPTLDELLILKYKDKGKKKKLRIISEASHKWKDIANLICSDTNVTSVLEPKCHSDPNECLKQTLISYFISKKPQGYTQDWNGLIELLDDVNLETLAENVKHALSCT